MAPNAGSGVGSSLRWDIRCATRCVFCASVRGAQIEAVPGGEVLAHLDDGFAGALGGDAHVDDERVTGPDPQVVGVSPVDLIEQVRNDTGADHRHNA